MEDLWDGKESKQREMNLSDKCGKNLECRCFEQKSKTEGDANPLHLLTGNQSGYLRTHVKHIALRGILAQAWTFWL